MATNSKHLAIVMKGGAVLVARCNSFFTHAEVRALKCLWPSKRVGTKVISLRFFKDGKLANAKPCYNCQEYMYAAGVRSCQYSTGFDTPAFATMRIRGQTPD